MTTRKRAVPPADDTPPAEDVPLEDSLPPLTETAATNGQAPADPPGEVAYNPLKLSSLRSRSDVLKGVWTDPSRVPIWSVPEVNTFVRTRPGMTTRRSSTCWWPRTLRTAATGIRCTS